MRKSKLSLFLAVLAVTLVGAMMFASASLANNCCEKKSDKESCDKKDCDHPEGYHADKKDNDGVEPRHPNADMDFDITAEETSMDSFIVVGMTLDTSLKDYKYVKDIPAFWEEVMKLDLFNLIPNQKREGVILGVVTEWVNEWDYTYMIGMEVKSAHEFPKGLVAFEIPKNDYVKFTVKGKMPDVIGPAWEHIFMKWFEESDIEYLMDSPAFEWYDSRFKPNAVSEIDIYIPVKEKSK